MGRQRSSRKSAAAKRKWKEERRTDGRPKGGRPAFEGTGKIVRRSETASGQVRQPRGIRKLKGTVEKNRRGFGFVSFETRGIEDLFLPPREAQSLFHGDRIEVTLSGQKEILGLKVLEHRFRELVGKYTPHPLGGNRGGWVVFERKRAREEVFAPKPGRAGAAARADDWVRAELRFHETGPYPVTAEIVEVYGSTLPPSADIGMIANEYSLDEHHSERAIREAEAFGKEIRFEKSERTDLRNVPFITIDGETARDFDDAVFVERRKEGNFILWVAIADVSHYVRDGSHLDKEARSRGTSVYFPERAFHMLPRALSENLCSLRPQEPRLALVARMDFHRSGKRRSTQVIEAVIESRRRATYNEIQAEREQNKADRNWEYTPHFELYDILRRKRISRGSIDFDLPEPEIVTEPTGEVISITRRGRMDSHRLIEEFMIAANEAVTEWIMERKLPFVYRVHEEPSLQALEKFQLTCTAVGVPFSLEGGSSPRVMAEFIRRIEGHPAQALLNIAFLRSLKQAIYTATHGIHYGLASQAYTHFTSPIRRYPDLIVHRMLRMALRLEAGDLPRLKEPAREKLEKSLEDASEHCSYRERLAADAEREAIKLKQVRAMAGRLGEEFEGRVVGMSEAGLFVQTDDPYTEGLVSRDSLVDDHYEFSQERMLFFGLRKRRIFRVGDNLRVRVLRADLDRRQIDFGPVTLPETGRQKQPR
ncbi:MAG: ribonuclease R [Bdellovibrionales bacterium GWB1_55_8]|nr:MAG: ribonuclease R [Bdellovibrionales bacterium GWB1_55_8]